MKERYVYNKEETASILNKMCMAYFIMRLGDFRLYKRIINEIPERINLSWPSYAGQQVILDVDWDFLKHSSVSDLLDDEKKNQVDKLFCDFYLFCMDNQDGKIVFLPMHHENPFLTATYRDDECGLDGRIIVGQNLGDPKEIIKWQFHAVVLPDKKDVE